MAIRAHGAPEAISEGSVEPFAELRGARCRPTADVAIARLVDTLTPRLQRGDVHHARTLAESYGQLPPILVHRQSMAIIDGVHRLMAAKLLGHEVVRVQWFDGSELDAYLEAVRLNTRHGKALTLGERKHAARRILAVRPESSDRRVAEICGLSPKTVATIRSHTGGAPPLVRFRIGRDGKRRPTDPTMVRLAVADLLKQHPDASARTVAAAASTSQATVLDVRRRMERGESPVPGQGGRSAGTPEPSAPLETGNDAAFASTAAGREFCRWFDGTRIAGDELARYAEAVPRSRIYIVADEARARAVAWNRFAALIEARAGASPSRRHG
jgi:ParB-like nuclease domain